MSVNYNNTVRWCGGQPDCFTARKSWFESHLGPFCVEFTCSLCAWGLGCPRPYQGRVSPGFEGHCVCMISKYPIRTHDWLPGSGVQPIRTPQRRVCWKTCTNVSCLRHLWMDTSCLRGEMVKSHRWNIKVVDSVNLYRENLHVHFSYGHAVDDRS